MRGAATHSGFQHGLHDWLAVVLAELRSLRRLARTWVFLALGIGVMCATFAYYSYLHATFSAFNLTSGNVLPRFTTAYFNSYVLWFFMAALVFLAFDLRHRDERERLAEAIDSRPLSNIALLGGRLCAVVLAILLPLFGVLLLIQAVGTIGRVIGWWVDPIEPVAMFLFFFLDAIPASVLWCAIVFLLVASLRRRLAVAIAALALLGIHMWLFAFVPAYLLPAVSLLYIHDNWASDLAPRLPEVEIYLHRASMLALAAAFVVWAAALHKRPDARRQGRRAIFGSFLAALASVGIGVVVLRCIEGIELRDSWLAAHRAVAKEPAPLVDHVEIDVRIDPGEIVDLELDMRLNAGQTGLARLLFSFNPGLRVTEIRLDDAPTTFRHDRGLLIVEPPQPLPAQSLASLSLRAAGVPDSNFAYLDSIVDWRRESSRNAMLWLGTAGGIFEKRYVALMPSLRWLPMPGPNLDDAARGHLPTIDMTVQLPDGWLVAGPGRRDDVGPGRFRFRPQAGVQKVGLFASRFERRTMEVAGVELELLLHPSHLRNLDYYDGTGDLIRSRLEQIFDDAAEFGIAYPYGALSVVEIPAHLREYGGGHWLDTRMGLPGLLLLKEHGFPYANVWLYNDPGQFAAFPGGLDALKALWLETIFSNPFSSGSAHRSFSRNLTTFQTSAVGPGAHALDYVGEEIGRELFRDPRHFRYAGPTMYTAHITNSEAGFGATVARMIGGLAGQDAAWTGFRPIFPSQPSVWERALGASLTEMDFDQDPSKAIGAFALRGNAVARSFVDGLGRDRAAALLAELRRHGGPYETDDFHAAVTAVDGDMDELVGDWMTDVGLPGFIVSRARIERVADDAGGQPRYEILVHVRNDEPTPGLVRLRLGMDPQSPRSEPVRVDGNTTVEVVMVSAGPPQVLLLEPYLALNRGPVRIDIDGTVEQKTVAREPFVGFRPSTWSPPTPNGIVIDDLDAGFSTEYRREDSRLGSGPASAAFQREFDQGLPTWTREPGEWTRATIPSSWGKYRHTVAGAVAGDGEQVAVFTAELPEPGRWQLEFHVPDPHPVGSAFGRAYGVLGSFHMQLVANGETTPAPFDGAAAEPGWAKVGEFDLASTEVRLEITSETDGEMVIADAIRWVPQD